MSRRAHGAMLIFLARRDFIASPDILVPKSRFDVIFLFEMRNKLRFGWFYVFKILDRGAVWWRLLDIRAGNKMNR